MPLVLMTGATVTQNSPFSFLPVAVAIASTHCAYLYGGMSGLSRPG